MGRYISSVAGTASDMTSNFASSNSTKNGDGFLTAYTANDITYSNVTYSSFNGGAAQYGGTYIGVAGWTETNNLTNQAQTITVNYDAATGEVSSLSIA
jgi:hypothetical protein